jgi:uncharacterized membrane protein required for colicin V production
LTVILGASAGVVAGVVNSAILVVALVLSLFAAVRLYSKVKEQEGE